MNIEEGRRGGNNLQSGVENYLPPPSAPYYSSAPPPPPQFYAHGYQAGPGYPVAEGKPVGSGYDHPLPCFGIGIGWLLFILGFFLGVIPWYIGAVMLCCMKDHDKREKSGFIACAIIAVFGTILIIVVLAIVANNNNNINNNY